MNTYTDLREIATWIGYEWAMPLRACETNWHKDIPALKVSERDPLRVVHKCARTELVWLHARNLHNCLFEPPHGDDVSVVQFLDPAACNVWNKRQDLLPTSLSPTV